MERKIVYNYKDEEALLHFKNVTTYTKRLSDCFSNEESLDIQVGKWMKTLKSFINKVFKKVRVTKRKKKKKDFDMDNLLNRRKDAIGEGDKEQQDILECKIKDLEAKRNIEAIKQQIENIEKNPRSRDNKFWKIKENYFPRKKFPF